MARIGEIITAQDLKDIQNYNQRSFEQQQYVNPAVYKLQGSTLARWNYYSTRDAAYKKALYLMNKPGGQNINPAGDIPFTGTAAATLGIACDFFVYSWAGWLSLTYADLRASINKTGPNQVIFRFYKSNGAGPYYAIFDPRYHGITATKVSNIPPEKLADLDNLHKQVQLLKADYNALAEAMNELVSKPFNPVTQQAINQGMIKLQNYQARILQLKGVDFTFAKSGSVTGIGVVWFVPIIILAVIASITVVAYRYVEKAAEVEKIRSDNNTLQFIADLNKKIAADPTISETLKKQLIDKNNNIVDRVNDHKDTIEKNANQPSFLDKVENIAIAAAVIFILPKLLKNN